MNKLPSALFVAAIALMLAASPLLTAGPGPLFSKNGSATAKPAPAVATHQSCAQCQSCATCCAGKAQAKQAS